MTELPHDRDQLASDALEAALIGDEMPTDGAVRARVEQMHDVRRLLADDADGPSEQALEAMLSDALRLTTLPERDSGGHDHDPGPIDAAVELREHRRSRRRSRSGWIAAAAAVLVVLVGFALLQQPASLDESAGDSAGLSSDPSVPTARTQQEPAEAFDEDDPSGGEVDREVEGSTAEDTTATPPTSGPVDAPGTYGAEDGSSTDALGDRNTLTSLFAGVRTSGSARLS